MSNIIRPENRDLVGLPIIHPEDSVSNTGKNSASTNTTYQTVITSENIDSAKSTISIMIYKSKQKEIELTARSAALKEKNRLEAQKAEIQKQLEMEEAEEELILAKERLQRMETKQKLREKQAELERKQSELEIDSNLEATKAITRVLYQKEDPVINFKEPLNIASTFIPKQTTNSLQEILERSRQQHDIEEIRSEHLRSSMKNGENFRGYMKDNNEMLKRQYEHLEAWKDKVQHANVANKEKFEQTEVLICYLHKENEELSGKVMVLEKELQEKYHQVENIKHENELINSQKQRNERQVEELKQTLSLLEKMKNEAEDKGEPIPSNETVLVQMSLENEKKVEELQSLLDRQNEELKEARNTNDVLLKDLKVLQKLKEQKQQDYQKVSRENIELTNNMEAGLTLNSINSVSWFHATKKLCNGEDGVDMGQSGNRSKEPEALPTDSNKAVEDLQQSAIDDLRKFQESKNKDYEDQIAQLLKSVQEHQKKNEEQLQVMNDKERELQELKSKHEQELSESSKLYEDKMAEFAKKLDSDREEQLKLQSSANENVESLKAQVIELMREVHELSSKIEAANNSLDRKNERIRDMETKYNRAVQDLMVVERQKADAVNTLQQRCQFLQTNYLQEHEQHEKCKNELQDLRESFNRLIEDYKELYNTFKTNKEQTSSEEVKQLKNDVNKLTCQVIVAEEALTMRDETVEALKKEMATLRKGYEEKIAIFRAQAEVFKMDFDAERQAREKQAQEKNSILQDMADLQTKNQQLVDEMEAYSQNQLAEMQQRVRQQPNSIYRPPSNPNSSWSYQSYPSGSSQTNLEPIPRPADQLQQVEEHEFTCPKCNLKCPDLDSLQIHVVDCMDLD